MSTPATTAAVTPPAAAVSPPVKMPIQPSEATASRTPLASVWPKPVRGDRGPGAAPLGQGLIQPQGTEQHAHYHVSGENAGGGQLSLVDDDLSHGAQDTAAEKRVEIFHEMSPPLFIRAVCPVPAGLCSAARRHRSPGRDETMGRKEMFIPHPGVRRIPLLRFGL